MENSKPIKTPQQTLDDWKSRARLAIFAHRYAAKGFKLEHLFIGIPLVVLTAFIGTSIFAALERGAPIEFRIFAGFCCVLATILASVQTFLKWRERSDEHNRTAAGYAAVRRQIEQYEAFKNGIQNSEHIFFDAVRIELDTLATRPPVPEKYMRKAEKEIKRRDKEENLPT